MKVEKLGRLAILEIFATGLWLGLMQVSLGFALLCGAGASILYYFLLVTIWICGSAAGVLLSGGRVRTICLCLAMLLALGSFGVLRTYPFAIAGTILCLSAGLLCGAYAGLFFRDSIGKWKEIRNVLLHENNGFILGYAAATLLLFVSVMALNMVALLLGAALLARAMIENRQART